MLQNLGYLGFSQYQKTGITPPPPTGFSPSDISNLALSLEASEQSGSGLLSQWDDQSGNGNHAVQAVGASQPYLISVPDNDNAVTFNAEFLDVTGITHTGDFTITSVVRAFGGFGYIFNTSGTQAGLFLELSTSANTWGLYNGSTIIEAGSNLVDGELYNITIKQESGTLYLYEDGILKASGASAMTISSSMEIGRNSFPFYLKGLLQDFYVYTKALDDTERGQLDSYITTKHVNTNAVTDGVFLGDSIVATATGGDAPVIFADYTNATNLAVGGNTIDQQKSAWNSYGGQATAEFVLIQVGVNDCLSYAEAASVAMARYQLLVDQIRADVGASVPIIISKMLPAKQRWIDLLGATNGATAQIKFEAMNEAITGNGAFPVTGIDYRLTAHYDALDDGSGDLLTIYDSGDHIHPNNNGRYVNGRYFKQAIDAVL